MKKFFLAAAIIFSSIVVFAQDAENTVSGETAAPAENAPAANAGFLSAPRQRGDFWICPGAETAFFSASSVSVGGSLAVAYGNKFSIGFKAAWFFDMSNELDALELLFLLRYYFMGAAQSTPSKGPYLQLTAGPALFFDKTKDVSLPAQWGTVSAGLTFGWRFLLGKIFFAEPYIRGGYPYIVGAGVSCGVRF